MIPLLLLLLCGPDPIPKGRYVGHLLRVHGPATLYRTGIGEGAALSLQQVRAGDRLATGERGYVRIVFYSDGKHVLLMPNSEVQVESGALKVARGTTVAKKPLSSRLLQPMKNVPAKQKTGPDYGGKVNRALGDAVEGPQDAVRTGDGVLIRFQLSNGTMTLADERGATIESATLAGPGGTWSPKRTLPSGRYIWKVTIPKKSPARGGFRVLTPGERQAVEAALAALKGVPRESADDLTPEFLRAAILEGAGLIDEAADAYREILRHDPKDETVVRWLNRYEGKE